MNSNVLWLMLQKLIDSGEAATLEEVGAEIGLTRERVRQIQVEALKKLRRSLEKQGLSLDAIFES